MKSLIIDEVIKFLGKNTKANIKTVERFNKELNIPKSRLRQYIDINNYVLIDYQVLSNKFTLDNSNFRNNVFYGDLIDLIALNHDKYYKNNKAFNIVKNIKFLCFKYQYTDRTDLKLIFFNFKDKETFKHHILKINSFKYKAIFKRKERKLLYRLKNNYNYKYGYNWDYMTDLTEKKEILRKEIKEVKEDIKEQYEIYNNVEQKLKERSFIYSVEDLYDILYNIHQLEDEIDDIKNDIKEIEKIEDNLLFSLGNESLNSYNDSLDYYNCYNNPIIIDNH